MMGYNDPLLGALGSLLNGESVLLTHGRDNGDHDLLAVIEHALNLVANLAIRNSDIVLGSTVAVHEVEETVVDIDKLELSSNNVGDVHVVGRGRQIFELLVGENLRSTHCKTLTAGQRKKHTSMATRWTLA